MSAPALLPLYCTHGGPRALRLVRFDYCCVYSILSETAFSNLLSNVRGSGDDDFYFVVTSNRPGIMDKRQTKENIEIAKRTLPLTISGDEQLE